MSRVLGMCMSEKRGTIKKEVNEAMVKENYGIVGDAHAGAWHRQVSLLSYEKIEAFRNKGADVVFGDFGENLIIDGFDFRNLPVTTRFQIGEVLLEITQIGKECHTHCQIYHRMGDCIMPKQGVFAKVIKGGKITVGDEVKMIPASYDKKRIGIITLNEQQPLDEEKEKMRLSIVEKMQERGYIVEENLKISYHEFLLKKELLRLSDGRQLDLILLLDDKENSSRDVLSTIATQEIGDSSVIRNQTLIIDLLVNQGKSIDSLLDMINKIMD